MFTLYLTTLIIAPQLWVPPFVGIPVDYFMYPLWFLVASIQGRIVDFFKFRAIDWFFLAMLGWIAVTTVMNTMNVRSIPIAIDYFKWFILYRLVIISLPTFPHLRRVMWLILFFVMVLVVEGIQHKLSPNGIGWAGQPLGWVDPSVLAAGGTGRTKWVNIFDGPGVFCVIYTIGLPVVLVLLGPPFGVVTRIFGYLLLGPLLLATYYTGSRGGLLAALGILAFYLLIRLRISVAKIGIVAGIIGIMYMAAPDHLTSIRDENKSAQHRVEVWAQGVDMVTNNPIFGIGKGNYRVYTGRLIAHSSPIEIMGETGVVGLFLWVSLIYLAVKGLFLYRAGPYNDADKAYATALALIVFGYVLSAMFVTLEYETFYFLIGLCAVVGNNLKEKVRYTRRDFAITFIVPLVWILFVKIFATLYF